MNLIWLLGVETIRLNLNISWFWWNMVFNIQYVKEQRTNARRKKCRILVDALVLELSAGLIHLAFVRFK